MLSTDSILLFNSPDRHFPVLAKLISPHGIVCCLVPFNTAPDLNTLMRKSVTFAWEFMFTRSLFNTHDLHKQRDILNTVAALLDTGKIKSIASMDMGTIDAKNILSAHQHIEAHRTIGKLTLTGF